VEQISGGNQTKLSKIREVRKSIARIQTVINQETLHQVRKKYSGKEARHRPRDLRQKKTKAIRKALKPNEEHKKTARALTKINNFPQRRFAVKA
jgi:large subunit ribosomal protein L35e